MGCMKSKQTFPFPTTLENEKRHASEESFMPEGRLLPRMPLPVVKEKVETPTEPNSLILEYAHRLSQEILNDALQQWACNNIRYCDIPYIESEGP
ncbi:PREDICTED: small membrane A-kinase anchor protein [Chrysochloris asiatica]|uniref:Small membrane A-kinase anchor protein n=1 Tax=Chrysochloris asiatica TaxID=185453 RepID=A0A9B0WPF5_CHRAS|nr:PREDICTED: small membrane A-kinase anchor protein [Chrysochloris asiatica]